MPRQLKSAGSVRCDVVGVGECGVDWSAGVVSWPASGGKSRLAWAASGPGGQVATALIGCARLGQRARFVGAVGGDEAAAGIRSALAEAGVEATLLTRPNVSSRVAVILVDQAGDRRVLEFAPPQLNLSVGEIPAALWTDARLLMLDTTNPPVAEDAARAARRADVVTMLDADRVGPDVESLMQLADVLVMPEATAVAAAGRPVGEALSRLASESGAALVVATSGERGALGWSQGVEYRVPAFPVAVVDTTGAGDAFRAGLAAAWLERPDERVDRLLRQAAAVAALNCRMVGALAGLPGRAEVAALLDHAGNRE